MEEKTKDALAKQGTALGAKGGAITKKENRREVANGVLVGVITALVISFFTSAAAVWSGILKAELNDASLRRLANEIATNKELKTLLFDNLKASGMVQKGSIDSPESSASTRWAQYPKGTNEYRSFEKTVTFESAFKVTPEVFLSVVQLDAVDNGANRQRWHVRLKEVHPDRFTVEYKTWNVRGDSFSVIDKITVSWLALSPDMELSLKEEET
ncbi:MAG: H-type lectin domain-containing protein [Verrucomicrobiota bacterium]